MAKTNDLFLLCRRSTHDFDNFFRDLCLAHAVHRQGQRVNHVGRIVRSGFHGSHAGCVLGGYGLKQRMKNLNTYILGQERVEQLTWGLLVNIVHRRGTKPGCLGVD